MPISDITNRGPFLVYESNAVRINDEVFPANNINIGLSASIDRLMDIDGRVPNYAPNGPLQGVVDISFDLTGALPTYFRATGIVEAPVRISFNNIFIFGYLQNMNFSVQPYEPITVNSSFAFYHGIRHIQPHFQDPFAINFDSSLKTYNGAVCRLVNQKGGEKLNYSLISNLDYNLNVQRTPYTKVGYESPTRVTVEDVNVEMNLEGSNIDKYMSIKGNPIEVTVKLNELYSRTATDAVYFTLDGRVIDQSFVASQGSFGMGKLKAIQTLPRIRSVETIPFVDTELQLEGKATPPELLDFGAICPSLPVGPGLPGSPGEGPGEGGWVPPGGGDPGCDDGNCEDETGETIPEIPPELGDYPKEPTVPPPPETQFFNSEHYKWAAIYIKKSTTFDSYVEYLSDKATYFFDGGISVLSQNNRQDYFILDFDPNTFDDYSHDTNFKKVGYFGIYYETREGNPSDYTLSYADSTDVEDTQVKCTQCNEQNNKIGVIAGAEIIAYQVIRLTTNDPDTEGFGFVTLPIKAAMDAPYETRETVENEAFYPTIWDEPNGAVIQGTFATGPTTCTCD